MREKIKVACKKEPQQVTMLKNYGIIREAMAEQSKGLHRLRNETGMSITGIRKVRDGENVHLLSLALVLDALGYELEIVKKKN